MAKPEMKDERFWQIETMQEGAVVKNLLWRRFPFLYDKLSDALEEADPLEVVYPNNPNEYSDVVREVIVLLAPVNGRIQDLSHEEVTQVIRRGLKRCFGESPSKSRLKAVVDLLMDEERPL
jgi:hypothetical protein